MSRIGRPPLFSEWHRLWLRIDRGQLEDLRSLARQETEECGKARTVTDIIRDAVNEYVGARREGEPVFPQPRPEPLPPPSPEIVRAARERIERARLDKFADGNRFRARKAARERVEREVVRLVRQAVEARERGVCRCALDGHAFSWCTRHGTDLHEAAGVRGMGGRSVSSRPLTTANAILTCHACHMAHHDGRLRIEIVDADALGGVTYRT